MGTLLPDRSAAEEMDRHAGSRGRGERGFAPPGNRPFRPAGGVRAVPKAGYTVPVNAANLDPATRPVSAGRRWRPLRTLAGALLLLLLLTAVHAAVWQWMGNRLAEGFEDWAATRRAAGWRVAHDPPQRGGWPLAATLRLPNFRLRGGEAVVPDGLDWQAGALLLRSAPPRLDELRIEARGPQRLRLGRLDLAFAADRLEGRLPLVAGVPPRGGDLLAERLRVGLPGQPEGRSGAAIRTLRASLDTRSSATEGEAALSLSVAAEEVMLPVLSGRQYALGPMIAEAGLEAALTGPLPSGRVSAARVAAWRDAGGVLELRGLTLRWGEVAASAAATLALDDRLQPMGAGTLRLSGAEAALSALAEAGAIAPRAAATAARVAALLARPPPSGGPPELEVPLTLEERSVAVARVPTGRVPVLHWPTPDAP